MDRKKSQENDEKKRYEIEAYTANDPTDVPGWVFLTATVTCLYGICPHLSVAKPVNETSAIRRAWLAERADEGQTYYRAFHNLASGEHLAELTLATETAREELGECVRQAFDAHPEFGQLDPLLEVITSYKQSQNRSKKVKMAWESTMEHIRRIQAVINFDMLVYYDILTKAKMTKASLQAICSQPPTKDDWRLQSAMHNVLAKDKVLKLHLENVQTQHQKATDKLYELICADFLIAQEGRYFKRWYYLTEDEKFERINSFCEHYLGTIVEATDRSRLLSDLQLFVKEALRNKSLKISEVKWNTKAGKIDHILRLNFDGTNFCLDKVDEEIKRTRRTKNEAAISKKELALKNIDGARLNRVLLKQILSCPTHRKDTLIEHVLWKCCHCTTPQARACTRESLLASYATIWEAIKDAPFPASLSLTT